MVVEVRTRSGQTTAPRFIGDASKLGNLVTWFSIMPRTPLTSIHLHEGRVQKEYYSLSRFSSKDRSLKATQGDQLNMLVIKEEHCGIYIYSILRAIVILVSSSVRNFA